MVLGFRFIIESNSTTKLELLDLRRLNILNLANFFYIINIYGIDRFKRLIFMGLYLEVSILYVSLGLIFISYFFIKFLISFISL
jgi:uncharacterized membrane protein YhdT